MNNQRILEEFGKVLIKEVFDNQYKFIKNNIKDLSETKDYENLFVKMSDIQKKEIEQYTKEILKGSLFDFLRIFEENENFKLVYEENGKQINLVEINEMLKAEPLEKDGWIDRFSQELKNEK